MNHRSTGNGPKIRVDRTEIQVSPSSSGPVREELVVMNEGKGRLYGSVRSDASWVTVLDANLDTTFIQKIALEIRADKAPSDAITWVYILSTGGITRIKVVIQPSLVPVSTLRIDEKVFQFCSITKDETIDFSLTIRNSGPGFLSGTAVPLCDWIEIPVRGIWARVVQVIPVKVITAKAPPARHPVGRIHVRTNGGEEIVEVSIHRSPTKGPVARLTPSSLRISWSVKGIIEERLIIRNVGTGTLRGTIPSKFPWITAVPSIFSVEDFSIITIRVDTRLLPGTVPASVPVMVITNAGPYTLNLEIVRTYQAQVKPRMHVPRIRARSRMTVIDNLGMALQIVSSGKSGGEGEIWYIDGDESRCVKVFHPHRCSQEMEEKIQAMQKNPLHTPQLTGICWPAGIVRSAGTSPRFVGYIMTRLDSRFTPVHSWYDQPDQEFNACLLAAGRLAGLVEIVHNAGHCIGDLRENNVFISTSGEICLIDTDSFQITDPSSSRTWFCKVGTGEYLPPELINGSFEKQDIDRLFADRFALAVLIFRFLMQGAHPYQGRGPLIEDAPTTTDKILRGLFSYEAKIPGLYPPEYAPPYDRIPQKVRTLFHEAFVTGHQHPQARPEPRRWKHVLLNGNDRVSSGFSDESQESRILIHSSVQEQKIPEYSDEMGRPVTVGTHVIRIHHGEIRRTDRSGFQLLIGHSGFKPLVSCPKDKRSLPPSVILPEMMVYQEQKIAKAIRYLIPEIDFSFYIHWHIATDPESRQSWKGDQFSFRHRVAACRNLLFTVKTIVEASLMPFSLSPRSVFVGPDSSVKVIAVPREESDFNGERESSLLDEVRTLLFSMMMDGYHSSHDAWKSVFSPSFDVIPYPFRCIFTADRVGESLGKTLYRWFLRAENTLFSLVPCTVNPDHWYSIIPGYCPFCRPERYIGFFLSSGIVPNELSSPAVLLLSHPTTPVRSLKHRAFQRKHPLIPVIFLPCSLTVPFRISGKTPGLLNSQSQDNDAPGVWLKKSTIIPYQSLCQGIFPEKYLSPHLPAAFQPVYSLFDEMKWTGDMEYMKGELFPVLVPRKPKRRQYIRKTISVMIFPGVFIDPSPLIRIKTMKIKNVKKGKKISKTLSDFFEDFF
ncbi:hypothetical protein ACKUB1_08735 [Methanospirillum stamsii]|uniref:Protein kinase domain-containing protein n=1 Tax=Methanospirillum stamsii TaxID=1277351 RepID=A0A2V2NA92_9EURY|nr:hypothetical protein [Methanospirillum stamsii]PWR75515.1 hypothetical protein DLD82_05140 [Methanospirillum stamsii]